MTEQKPMTVENRIKQPEIISTYDFPIKIKGKNIGTGKLRVDHFNHELELEIESEILEKIVSNDTADYDHGIDCNCCPFGYPITG